MTSKVRILISWIGGTDIRTFLDPKKREQGPIATALRPSGATGVLLLDGMGTDASAQLAIWLSEFSGIPVHRHEIPLPQGPAHHETIFAGVLPELHRLRLEQPDAEFVFHLSPGTPAMASVWVLLSQTVFPGRLIQVSREVGYEPVELPFAIALDYVGTMDLGDLPPSLVARWREAPPDHAAFEDISHHGSAMRAAVAMARRAAPTRYPVLLLGESGTGKELFARAIHEAVDQDCPFEAINCGGIPESLLEAELFGADKGAYTGATRDRAGAFERAGRGTIFLDEVGELSAAAQSRLLRVLEDGTFERVGGGTKHQSQARVIAATNRDLATMVNEGAFREDLYYRLAVAVIKLPPLRARPEDLDVVADSVLARVNEELAEKMADFRERGLSEPARTALRKHGWPGNVRELLNTLRRAVVFSDGTVLTERDICAALLVQPSGSDGAPTIAPLPPHHDLNAEIGALYKARLEQALAAEDGKPTRAARRLGLKDHQTFGRLYKKHVLVWKVAD